MTGDHVPARLLEQYAGGTHAPADAVWALEAHLESCGACRDRLGELVGADTAALREAELACTGGDRLDMLIGASPPR
jgi:predicted anti-sigma-YlaC factor YlaD